MASKSTDNQQQITPDQAVAMMQYAYPGQSQGWYDIFRQNPNLATMGGVTFGGRPEGSQGSMIGGTPTSSLANLLRTFSPQQQAQAPPQQFQTPQLAPAQPTPQVPITPLSPASQYGSSLAQQAPTMNVPQANAPGAAPLFSLGSGQNWMLPQAQAPNPDQQVQRYQSGGLVTPQPQQGQMTDPWTGQPITGEQAGWANLGLYGAYPQGSAQANAINQMGSPNQAAAQYAPYFLGAAALQMPPVINLPPSGSPSTKSGVAPTPGAIIGTGTPQVPQGPWLTNPSVFARAPMPTVSTQAAPGWTGNAQMPLTAQTPANAAQMPQMMIAPAANAAAATPQPMGFAGGQPPAAPGPGQAGFPGGLQAHGSALANAGMAMYAHYGGDPFSASPADIANFHTQLSGMIGQHLQGGTAGPGAAGANTALATGPTIVPSGGAPKKMQTGGPVPGQGDDDTVPALLTPGEYVLNKQQVQALGRGKPVELSQVPSRIQQPQQGSSSSQSQPQATPANQPGSPAPAAPGGGNNQIQQMANMMAMRTMGQNAQLSANLPAYPSATTPAAQGYAAAANAGQIGGAAPTAAQVQGAAAMTPGQVQGSMAQANMGTASAIGGLASGIAQAAQTYANSIKPWQVQRSAIPTPPPAPAPPQLAQEQTR